MHTTHARTNLPTKLFVFRLTHSPAATAAAPLLCIACKGAAVVMCAQQMDSVSSALAALERTHAVMPAGTPLDVRLLSDAAFLQGVLPLLPSLLCVDPLRALSASLEARGALIATPGGSASANANAPMNAQKILPSQLIRAHFGVGHFCFKLAADINALLESCDEFNKTISFISSAELQHHTAALRAVATTTTAAAAAAAASGLDASGSSSVAESDTSERADRSVAPLCLAASSQLSSPAAAAAAAQPHGAAAAQPNPAAAASQPNPAAAAEPHSAAAARPNSAAAHPAQAHSARKPRSNAPWVAPADLIVSGKRPRNPTKRLGCDDTDALQQLSDDAVAAGSLSLSSPSYAGSAHKKKKIDVSPVDSNSNSGGPMMLIDEATTLYDLHKYAFNSYPCDPLGEHGGCSHPPIVYADDEVCMLLKKRVKTIGNNGRELVHYLVHRPGTLYLHDNDWVAASVLCKKTSTRQMVEAFDAELAACVRSSKSKPKAVSQLQAQPKAQSESQVEAQPETLSDAQSDVQLGAQAEAQARGNSDGDCKSACSEEL